MLTSSGEALVAAGHRQAVVLALIAQGAARAVTLMREAATEHDISGADVTRALRELEDRGLIQERGRWYQITALGCQEMLKDPEAELESRRRLFAADRHPGISAYDRETGELEIGRVVGQNQPAVWKLRSDSGAKHALVAASAGAGGSNVLRGAIWALAGSGVRVWGLDPEGAFEPISDLMNHHATVSGDIDQALGRARRIITERMKRLQEARVRHFSEISMSHGALIIDSVETLYGILAGRHEKVQKDLEFIARFSRKVGISLIVGARSVRLEDFGTLAFRESIAASRNILVLGRHDNVSTASVLPDLDGLPSIPRTLAGTAESAAGLGYDSTGRLVRAHWLDH